MYHVSKYYVYIHSIIGIAHFRRTTSFAIFWLAEPIGLGRKKNVVGVVISGKSIWQLGRCYKVFYGFLVTYVDFWDLSRILESSWSLLFHF